MKMMYQMDVNEMAAKLQEDPNYVPSLEDKIEFQHQAIMTWVALRWSLVQLQLW